MFIYLNITAGNANSIYTEVITEIVYAEYRCDIALNYKEHIPQRLKVIQLVKKFPTLHATRSSLPFTQEPEPDESSPHSHTLFL
jgi:hypothetical protein